MNIKYLHTMIRVKNLKLSIDFYCNILGLKEVRRVENKEGKFTLVFLSTEDLTVDNLEIRKFPLLELTYNWDNKENYSNGRNFGHLCYEVENIYEFCSTLLKKGIVINRPPRDGYMAFIKSPDEVSIELLQKGKKLQPKDPWKNMKNVGIW